MPRTRTQRITVAPDILTVEKIEAATFQELKQLLKDNGLQSHKRLTEEKAKELLLAYLATKKRDAERAGATSSPTRNKRQKPSTPESEGLDPVFQEDQMDSAFKVTEVNNEWEEANRWIANQRDGPKVIPTILSRTTQVRARLLKEGNLVLFAGKLTNKKWGLAIFKVVGQSESTCEISRVQLKVSAEFVSVSDSYSLDNSLEVYTWTAKDINCVTALMSSSLGYKGFDRGSRRITLLDDSREEEEEEDDSAKTATKTAKLFKYTDADGKVYYSRDSNEKISEKLRVMLGIHRACEGARYEAFFGESGMSLDIKDMKSLLTSNGNRLKRLGDGGGGGAEVDPWESTRFIETVKSLHVFKDNESFKRFVLFELFRYDENARVVGLAPFIPQELQQSNTRFQTVTALRNLQTLWYFTFGSAWRLCLEPCIEQIENSDTARNFPAFAREEVDDKLVQFGGDMRTAVSTRVRAVVPNLSSPQRCVIYLQHLLRSISLTGERLILFQARLGGGGAPRGDGSPRPVRRELSDKEVFCTHSVIFHLKIGSKGAARDCNKGANCKYKHLSNGNITPELKEWWVRQKERLPPFLAWASEGLNQKLKQ